MIGVGVLGLGFMGRTHVRCYQVAAAEGLGCRLAAVASPDPRELSTAGEGAAKGNLEAGGTGPLFDRDAVRMYGSAAALAQDADVQAVSVCTPTDTHVELASMLLRAGKHVLLEKPVALSSQEVEGLARVARDSGRLCMPAMCMRFWPGWDWLKARVEDGSLGKVRAASFTRLGARPGWSAEFYRDDRRCGGAMLDLHVHDVDVIYWLFGKPRAVTSAGGADHISTIYHFGDEPRLVTAEGGWVEQPSFPFRMRYTVEFDGAVADWDLTREKQLLLTRGGQTEHIAVAPGSGYEGEVRVFVRAVRDGKLEVNPTLAEAAEVLRIIEAERTSAAAGSERVLV
jgi:predicted dehydrogenase